MIPIGDNVQRRTFPYVNVALIAINVLVFLYELRLDSIHAGEGFLPITELDLFFFDWGALPACLTDRFGFEPDVPERALTTLCPNGGRVLLTPFTALFLHGGWLHLIGNMIFLWVFGDNVEDTMGHARYAVFYLLGGLAATAAHVAVNQGDLIPAVGASGAIAAVLGAYLLFFPRARISTIIPLFLFIWIPFNLPAVFLIGFWFLMQLFSGFAALSATDVVGSGGVAWFAHIGGFVAGLVLALPFLFGRRRPPRQPVILRPRPPRW